MELLNEEYPVKNLCGFICIFAILWVCAVKSAAHDGRLYIKNDHPTFQFECVYKVDNEQRGPITIYHDEIYLGLVRTITKVQVKRYGTVMGAGAHYYDVQDQLRICKSQPDRDWLLDITWSLKGWDITAQLRGEVVRREVVDKPLSYFAKAAAYRDNAEPRHLLDLPASYTAAQVDERQRALNEQISQERDLPAAMVPQILGLLNDAAAYAKRFLTFTDKSSADYMKALLTWRGKLHPERVASGKQIACNILGGSMKPIAGTQEYLNAIINLMWYFYDLAIQKDQPFDEGTFVIQDRQLRIYNFLMSYVKKVNPPITDTINDPVLNVSTNPFAYSRLSSHFKLEQRQYRHYGIDVRFGAAQFAQVLLPAQKTHILFGCIGNDQIFIKLENVGIAVHSVVMHGKEFVEAQLRKLYPNLRTYLQAWLPTYMDDLLTYYIGTDDDPSYRKERIPQELLIRCLDILKSATLSDEQIRGRMYAFATQGIHGVYNEIKNPASPLTQAQKDTLNAYLGELARQGLDNQTIRFGREIVLTRDELVRQCH